MRGGAEVVEKRQLSILKPIVDGFLSMRPLDSMIAKGVPGASFQYSHQYGSIAAERQHIIANRRSTPNSDTGPSIGASCIEAAP